MCFIEKIEFQKFNKTILNILVNMRQYRITTTDPLTAHRVAGVLYGKLCPLTENSSILPPGRQDIGDQVPGEYFQEGDKAGYRTRAEKYLFDVCVDSAKPKSARDYGREFTVRVDKIEETNLRDFERAVQDVQVALGNGRKGKA